ncbi:MAG: DPP IV N-terminal domain-containing protein [Sphaerobacter sp.]|nr:DPP IV N-terminal domain-containing protein [Sphaerobacter sp.]
MMMRTWRPVVWLGPILLLVLGIVGAACGAPDPLLDGRAAPGAPPRGRILYVKNGDVHVWDGDSTRITDVGDASYPRWSGDGTRFVFVRTGDAFSDLYVASADGSGMEQLTYHQPPLQPGTQAYVAQAMWALDPVWSRTGDAIAFVSDRNSVKNALWLIPLLGADPVPVSQSTISGENVEHPDFSPDGSQIVFAQRTTGESDLQRWTQLWKVDLNTGALEPLVQSEQGAYAPAWSPDGRWIAYVGRTGTANDIWVVPADGGTPIQLTHLGDVASPAWSPDGTYLAFFRADGASFKAVAAPFRVGADGVPALGNPETLFKDDGIDAVSGMSWAP